MKNMAEMMKQVQQMQTRMQEAQAALDDLEVTGQSGGGMVKVTLNGKGVMRGITMDDSLMNPDEREIAEDLIVAACNDARTKMEARVAEEMKSVTGGMALPPGMKLPF